MEREAACSWGALVSFHAAPHSPVGNVLLYVTVSGKHGSKREKVDTARPLTTWTPKLAPCLFHHFPLVTGSYLCIPKRKGLGKRTPALGESSGRVPLPRVTWDVISLIILADCIFHL